MNDLVTTAGSAITDQSGDPHAMVSTEYFIACMGDLAVQFDQDVSAERIQVMLDLFRTDGWKTYEFRLGCQAMARERFKFPTYADFHNWRQRQS